MMLVLGKSWNEERGGLLAGPIGKTSDAAIGNWTSGSCWGATNVAIVVGGGPVVAVLTETLVPGDAPMLWDEADDTGRTLLMVLALALVFTGVGTTTLGDATGVTLCVGVVALDGDSESPAEVLAMEATVAGVATDEVVSSLLPEAVPSGTETTAFEDATHVTQCVGVVVVAVGVADETLTQRLPVNC